MSIKSSLRYFTRGPGVVLVLVLVIVGIGYAVKQGNDRKESEKAKREKTRELGRVNQKDSVDASKASKETILAQGHLLPGYQTTQPVVPAFTAPTSPAVQPAALPTLVSFYAQVAATPTPTPAPDPERLKPIEYWLPPSIFIPCALVNTVESSHINTPIVGEVTRDCYQNGKLIIPAGTLVSSFASSGAVRDRIEVAGTWLFVFTDGRQLKVPGIACDREADPSNQQFGVEDGSAGLRGELQESNHWANAQALIALMLTSTTQVATAGASSVLSHGGGGVGLPDTTPILQKYLDQLFNGETGDGRYVRVPASTEFYIFPTETVLPSHRSVVNGATTKSEEPPLSSDPVQQALQTERDIILRNQQPQSGTTNDTPKFHY